MAGEIVLPALLLLGIIIVAFVLLCYILNYRAFVMRTSIVVTALLCSTTLLSLRIIIALFARLYSASSNSKLHKTLLQYTTLLVVVATS